MVSFNPLPLIDAFVANNRAAEQGARLARQVGTQAAQATRTGRRLAYRTLDAQQAVFTNVVALERQAAAVSPIGWLSSALYAQANLTEKAGAAYAGAVRAALR